MAPEGLSGPFDALQGPVHLGPVQNSYDLMSAEDAVAMRRMGISVILLLFKHQRSSRYLRSICCGTVVSVGLGQIYRHMMTCLTSLLLFAR